MKLLVIMLKKERLLEKIITILLETGMFDSSVIDGENIETLAKSKMPLFTSFKALFGADYSYNMTIISPVYDSSSIKDFVKICDKEGIDFSNPETGTLLSLPAAIFTGNNEDDL